MPRLTAHKHTRSTHQHNANKHVHTQTHSHTNTNTRPNIHTHSHDAPLCVWSEQSMSVCVRALTKGSCMAVRSPCRTATWTCTNSRPLGAIFCGVTQADTHRGHTRTHRLGHTQMGHTHTYTGTHTLAGGRTTALHSKFRNPNHKIASPHGRAPHPSPQPARTINVSSAGGMSAVPLG